MRLKDNTLQINLKVQDEFRRKIANLGKETIEGSLLQIGDSEIDYQMLYLEKRPRILEAPFGNCFIKYPFLFNAADNLVNVTITAFARKVVVTESGNGKVQSTYNYPIDDTITDGQNVPTIDNGKNINSITFGTQATNPEGYIIFIQSVLNSYFDEKNNNLRLLEEYEIKTFNNLMQPITLNNSWDISQDMLNGSFLISKLGSTGNNQGLLRVKGKTSNKEKIIQFNY